MRLLGELAAYVDGQPVDLGPPRQRCMFAALAVEADRVVPVDRLIERVWGVDVPRRARPTLHSYISRLRRVLASAHDVAIVRRSGGYALTAGGTVDLQKFRDLCARAREDDANAARLLTEALRLWQGDALTGVEGEWAEAERERLAQERLAAQHDLVDARLRAGQGEDLVVELSERAAEHPLDERVQGQYMRALHQAGRSADALDHYRQTRQRLVDELGVDPGGALQDVHRQILAAGSPAEPTPPRQLPAAPASFVGRLGELDRLGPSPGGGTVVISAIAGAGGIGKTWLALHWAHRHASRFPDGQLFVDLRGFSPESNPMDPAVAVRGFLEALGADTVPADPHARTALFRSLIAGKRMLLVLDNAVDTAQVTPLLPGSETCTVLVTSRNRLPGLITQHGARHLSLDVLSDAEALALLTARLGPERLDAEPDAVERLISLCGGFPLALSIIAAQAHTRPQVPLSALAEELRELDDDDPAASLPAVLSWSLHALNPKQATAFALLGVAPGPDISLAAAASLIGLSLEDTRIVLRGLQQSSLLSQGADGRYRMHDLIRRHAAGHVALPDPAVQRVLDFYLHTLLAADRELNPHRDQIQVPRPIDGAEPLALSGESAALAWLDAEHQCLLAAQQAARGQQAWNLAWALETFLRRRGHLRDRLTVWLTGLDAAEHMSDPTIQMLTHRFLGRANADLGRHTAATDHLDRALALAEQHGDQTNQAHAHRTLAAAWVDRGDGHKAHDHARRALELSRAVGNPTWEAGALNAVGWYAAKIGRYEEASEHCVAALDLFRRQHNAEGEATTLDSLGYIAGHTGNHTDAVTHYRAARILMREIGSSYLEADTLNRLGQSYTALGRHEEAQHAWQEALELYRIQNRKADADRVQRSLDRSVLTA
ncbi:BTAD domain-containing putative transcriptional regulator [Actinocrispum sp. NPDC049592]|uniref:AfsR/SARP family transcriptional regulator n=1 Tax=Actinocrispum sp. NPDC049592 TaxID=3154835 RepID=UPI003414CF9C